MPKTRRDLIDVVLDKLGVLVPGQAPGSEIVDRVDKYIDPSAAALSALGIIYIDDVGTGNPPQGGEIDDAVVLYLGDCIAWQSAGGFNLSDSVSLKALAIEAEEKLRIIGRPARTRQTLRTDLQLTNTRIRAPIGNYTRGT